jgi:hypothetical protein
MIPNVKYRFFVPLLWMCLSCNPAAEQPIMSEPVNPTPPRQPDTPATKPLQRSDSLYFTKIILNDSIRKALPKQYADSVFRIICALNRIDPDKLHRADSLILPSVILPWMDFSPFPDTVPALLETPEYVAVSYRLQAFGAYKNGVLQRWGPVSMGKRSTPTPTGLFHTNWKSKRQVSTENENWILPWYFNIINSSGVSFHQYELPGFPASHSCIRMRETDARWLYQFAQQWTLDATGRMVIKNGTPVYIFGRYPWGKGRPWFELLTSPSANKLPADSLLAP